MKELPMLMSAPMVRAILAGTKTQTRRVVKPQPFDRSWSRNDHHIGYTTDDEGIDLYAYSKSSGGEWRVRCPYGKPGDLLWVRETWQGPLLESEEHEVQFREDGPEAFRKPGFCAYRATDTLDAIDEDGKDLGWRPSIHMPRWASRILLEIVSVRVERLQDISEDDATAEGLSVINEDDANLYYSALAPENQWPDGWHFEDPVGAYRELWESINGPGSWDANPFVWVVEFKRVQP